MIKNNIRKVIIIIAAVILISLLIFLVNKFVIRSKVVRCELNKNNSANKYEQIANYTIYSKKDNVTRVEMNESISSKNTTIVKYLSNQMKKNYEKEKNKYTGYNLEVKEDRNKSTFNITIDYSKLNIKDYTKDKNIKEDNNKVSLKNMKEYYEMLGADCK